MGKLTTSPALVLPCPVPQGRKKQEAAAAEEVGWFLFVSRTGLGLLSCCGSPNSRFACLLHAADSQETQAQ